MSICSFWDDLTLSWCEAVRFGSFGLFQRQQTYRQNLSIGRRDRLAQRLEHQHEPGPTPVTAEDRELTLAFQRGEKGAYQAIHDRYADRVHRVCRRMLANPQDAQEAAQESFLKIYQALGRFNGRYQLGAWIARIATNVCLDQLRARARRPIDDVQLEMLELAGDTRVEKDDPEFILLNKSEGRRLNRTLLALPPMHRAAIVLRDIEGLSYLEIAQTLDMSEGQVKALLHRARAGFKRSWLSKAVSALIPARFIHRTRIAEHLNPNNEHVLQTVGGSLNAAASCGATLAQCGQYVSERAAAGIAALVVGSAAVAGAGVSVADTRPEPKLTEAPVAVDAASAPVADKESTKKDDGARAELPEARREVPPPQAPSQSPEPSATPTTEPTPEATTAPDPKDEPEIEPATGFYPSVGFEWGQPIPARVPRSHTATVSCKEPVVIQELETSIDDGKGRVRPALMKLSIGTAEDELGTASLELTVDPGPNEIYYSGTASFSEDLGEGETRRMRYEGEYGTFNQKANATGLPQSGDFKVLLGLDCAAQSIVTESVILTTE